MSPRDAGNRNASAPDVRVREAQALAYVFDSAYLRERGTAASPREATTLAWLAVADRVIALRARGMAVREIANVLGLGDHTSALYLCRTRRTTR